MVIDIICYLVSGFIVGLTLGNWLGRRGKSRKTTLEALEIKVTCTGIDRATKKLRKLTEDWQALEERMNSHGEK
jgi:hypothetical protein